MKQICIHDSLGIPGLRGYGVNYVYADDLDQLKARLVERGVQRLALYTWDTLCSEGGLSSSGKRVGDLSADDWEWLTRRVAYENRRILPL